MLRVPLVLSLCFLALAGGRAQQPAASAAVVHPPQPLAHFRVTWMEDPARKAVISWTTPVAGEKHVVYFDTQPRARRAADYARRIEALPTFRFTMEEADAGTPEGWAHHAFLENLEPATTYYFTIESDGRLSREFHFVTAPDDARPVKLLFGGDSRRPPALGQPHLHRREVNRLIAELVEQEPDILAFAHGGDYCSRAEWRFMTDWLSDHELTITKAGRILPVIPARGNHDHHVGFEEIFFWPGRTHDFYFTTMLSSRVALLTLNTEISVGGDQRTWLEAELQRQRNAPGRWVAAQYHRPAYGSVKAYEGGAPLRLHWVPLFERHQIDLVCESDHHMLKRTVPIFADKHDPERGIVYIGDGGLGVPQREPDGTRWYLKSPGFAKPAHHVHVLEFGDEELRVRAIGLDRGILDAFAQKPKSPALVAAGAQ